MYGQLSSRTAASTQQQRMQGQGWPREDWHQECKIQAWRYRIPRPEWGKKPQWCGLPVTVVTDLGSERVCVCVSVCVCVLRTEFAETLPMRLPEVANPNPQSTPHHWWLGREERREIMTEGCEVAGQGGTVAFSNLKKPRKSVCTARVSTSLGHSASGPRGYASTRDTEAGSQTWP